VSLPRTTWVGRFHEQSRKFKEILDYSEESAHYERSDMGECLGKRELWKRKSLETKVSGNDRSVGLVLGDELLKALNIKEDPQVKMNNAEVMKAFN